MMTMDSSIDDKFNDLILAVGKSCSDLHITAGRECFYRVDGILKVLPAALFSDVEIQQLVHVFLPEKERREYLRKNAIDTAYTACGRRLRISIYRQSNQYAFAIRFINKEIPSIDDGIYPEIIKKLVLKHSGLILLTGPAGSGKSTTLSAMLAYRAEHSPCHIITLEDPIEYIFSSTKSLIHQREYGSDFFSFAEAMKSALRQDPDIIFLGEIRDQQTMRAALSAAQTGHLVLSTLHTASAAESLIRIESLFKEEAAFIRVELSMVLQAIISQQLLQKKTGGRICAMEILTATDAVRSLIAAGRPQQVVSVMQTGKNEGMQTMETALSQLRQKKLID
ncbi:type IV pilus twitching motility protein PilT [Pectinatus cerevisiiphilus]|uniref:Twitching motility protein PilT n=1 Tax=Pectinatus cerevisiiphilus TaxID=86956 RepID=A0A4R3K8V7_9FIRM|nr:PilT/PilU family type 4a pilus ATPase [Pectinatus cerevisiiphilus]TCS79347.1 twitching motility protein PilT [Pectinatus cerevisiiphilus]